VLVPDALQDERLAILVHEVRSPVAALSAIAETVRATAVDDDTRAELIGLVLAACRGIERLVGDLDLASVRRERVEVVPLVANAVAAARLRGLEVEMATVDGGAPVVDGDPTRLRQALDNVLANALTHAGGSDVLVTVGRVKSAVEIAVADRGGGIPESEHDRVLEPGVRLDDSKPGSGLGLAVTRAVVEAHGGRVSIRATERGGATVVISLPVAPNA
jgi:signal transduction histidine kinase